MAANDFDLILYLVQRFVDLLITCGIGKRIKHGCLTVEVKIVNSEVVYAKPQVEFGIKI